jgi:hypothetical protein
VRWLVRSSIPPISGFYYYCTKWNELQPVKRREMSDVSQLRNEHLGEM